MWSLGGGGQLLRAYHYCCQTCKLEYSCITFIHFECCMRGFIALFTLKSRRMKKKSPEIENLGIYLLISICHLFLENLQKYQTHNYMFMLIYRMQICIGWVPIIRDFLGLRFPYTRVKHGYGNKIKEISSERDFSFIKTSKVLLNVDYHIGM